MLQHYTEFILSMYRVIFTLHLGCIINTLESAKTNTKLTPEKCYSELSQSDLTLENLPCMFTNKLWGLSETGASNCTQSDSIHLFM